MVAPLLPTLLNATRIVLGGVFYKRQSTFKPTWWSNFKVYLKTKFGFADDLRWTKEPMRDMQNLVLATKYGNPVTRSQAMRMCARLETRYGGRLEIGFAKIEHTERIMMIKGVPTKVAYCRPFVKSIRPIRGGGVGGVANGGFWAVTLGSTLGGIAKAGADIIEKAAGYALFLQGLVMFADFMREEAVQTSAFGVFMAKENAESYAAALQQHFQILQLVIGSRWLLWFEWTERAFSSFFIAAIGSYKTWCNSLIDMCAEKYWVFNINAVDAETKTPIAASIYFNDQFQFTQTPQPAWTPISPSTLQRKIKVTLRSDDYEDWSGYYYLEPAGIYRSIRKTLGKVTLSVIKYKEIKEQLKQDQYISDEFRNVIKKSPLINLSLINKVGVSNSNLYGVSMNKDGELLDEDGNLCSVSKKPVKVKFTFYGKVDYIITSISNLNINTPDIVSVCNDSVNSLEKYYLAENKSTLTTLENTKILYSDPTIDITNYNTRNGIFNGSTEGIKLVTNIKDVINGIYGTDPNTGANLLNDVECAIIAAAVINAYVDQRVDNSGGKTIIGVNAAAIRSNFSFDFNNMFSETLTDEVLQTNTKSSIPTHKTVLDESPDIDWFNMGRTIGVLGEGAWNCKLMKTRGFSACKLPYLTEDDDLEVEIYEEYMFTSLTDVYYLQIGKTYKGVTYINTDGTIKDDAPVWIKRDSRLNELMPPMDIYTNLLCVDSTTRWSKMIDNSYITIESGFDKITGDIKIAAQMKKRGILEGTKYPVNIRILNVKNALVSVNNLTQGTAIDSSKGYAELVVYLPTDDSQYKISITNTETNEVSNEWVSFSRSSIKNKLITDEGKNVTVDTQSKISESDIDNELSNITKCDGKCLDDKDKFIIIISSFAPWPTKEKAIKQSGKLRIIVSCVDDAEIWIDGAYITTSGPADTGVLVDLTYGPHTITTIYNGIEENKWRVFTAADTIIEKYDKNNPVLIQNTYCESTIKSEKVKFIVTGVEDAIISLDGEFLGLSGKELAYFNVTPKISHRIRLSSEGYYDRVVDFYFDENTPFITLPDGTKENMPAFYYSFESNKISTSTSGRYKMREDYPFLRVSPGNAKITFTDIKSNKKYTYYNEQPIDNLPFNRDYVLRISANGFETMTDHIHFDGFFDYPNNNVMLKFKSKKTRCIC